MIALKRVFDMQIASILLLSCVSVSTLTACGHRQRASSDEAQVEDSVAVLNNAGSNEGTGGKKQNYAPPSIPVLLTDREQQADFVACHYWDNFPMADTSCIADTARMEQAFADYLYLLSAVEPPLQKKGFGVLLDKALDGSKAMYDRFAELLEHYLYDPNSPMRSETQYIMALEHMVAMQQLEDIDKYRPRYQLKMALKNRPGNRAADFGYRLRNGQSGRLSTLKSEYTLLYLFNPDCHACQEIATDLQSSPLISEMIASKRLTVLAIYPDEDMELWEKGKGKLPQQWLEGYDSPRAIMAKELYDLRATPTMLLLDKNKHVVLKDASVEELDYYLRTL